MLHNKDFVTTPAFGTPDAETSRLWMNGSRRLVVTVLSSHMDWTLNFLEGIPPAGHGRLVHVLEALLFHELRQVPLALRLLTTAPCRGARRQVLARTGGE